jgi:hypothetical protein
MPVVINEFEAVADESGAAQSGKGAKAPKSPVTSQARLMRAMARVTARQNRLRAY